MRKAVVGEISSEEISSEEISALGSVWWAIVVVVDGNYRGDRGRDLGHAFYL